MEGRTRWPMGEAYAICSRYLDNQTREGWDRLLADMERATGSERTRLSDALHRVMNLIRITDSGWNPAGINGRDANLYDAYLTARDALGMSR